MKEETFNELIDSVKEAGAIHRGEKTAARVTVVEFSEEAKQLFALQDELKVLKRKYGQGLCDLDELREKAIQIMMHKQMMEIEKFGKVKTRLTEKAIADMLR